MGPEAHDQTEPISGPVDPESAPADADLAYLLTVWPKLPVDLRAKIIGMARGVADQG